jgi:hypothetical protein
MAADKLQYAIGNSSSTTSSSSINNTDITLPLTSDTNFAAKSGEGLVLIDEGEDTEELAYATGKSGATLTIPLVNRGLEGGSAQAHVSGATVKGILSAGMWNNLIDALSNVVLKTTGALDTTKVMDLSTAQTLTNKTLTSPKINENVVLTATATELNQLDGKTFGTLSGDNTGDVAKATEVEINAGSDDTKYPTSKQLKEAERLVTTYSPAGAGTTTIDLALGNKFTVTMPANTQTLAISNETTGQCFILNINNVTSQGALTWFSTIRWATGSAPTLTGTNGKRDVFGFIVTGADTYDGFIVGQNV